MFSRIKFVTICLYIYKRIGKKSLSLLRLREQKRLSFFAPQIQPKVRYIYIHIRDSNSVERFSRGHFFPQEKKSEKEKEKRKRKKKKKRREKREKKERERERERPF